ncbi:MAG: peptidoglycan DD-metalloendopeptidase family protein [Heliobacteriaceae bacterium]|jgi:murein DD-endopeptidase MepM/ murein hydrolase activator NlpD|nr:peptidoglycan DD-metalloendopeptidase family protein [Heliobacteriaceae bacterium]
MSKKVFTAVLAFLIISTSALGAPTIEQKQKSTNDKIHRLKVLEGLEKNKLVKNQQKLENATNTLAVSQTKLNSLESQLKRLERDYSTSMAEYNAINNQMQGRIRKVFKNQRIGMFQLIFSAGDLNTLLDIIYFEKIILRKDYSRLTQIKVQSQSLAKMKYDIETRKGLLAQSINSISTQKKDITKAIAKNQTMLNKLKTDRAYYERTERELARQSANLQNMISKNKGTAVASSGAFARPIAGRISSPFGWRTHPIFNSRTFHSGVDIAGPNLGSIKASNAGRVIFSGWYGGYGKVVILDHGSVNGSPITTLYAHMSSIKVSQGQYVNKGDVVGYEGTTGYSTGPHCHFEVRVNGKPNNPLNYI